MSPKSHLDQKYWNVIKSADPNLPLVHKNPLYTVSNDSLRLLRPGTWLNDEIVNAYVALINYKIAKRSLLSQDDAKVNDNSNVATRMLCLNSFFMTKLGEEIE